MASGLRTIIASRRLIWTLTKREVAARYRGSALGLVWLVLLPLLNLMAFTFVFRTVLKARWAGLAMEEGIGAFSVYMFAGLTIFTIFAEVMTRSPGLVLENPSYIKRVVFPLEIMPIVALLTALVNAGGSMVIWLVFYIVTFGVPHPEALLLPIALAPMCLVILGLSWFVSAVGVYLRDLRQFVAPVVTALQFLSPVFYPLAAVPEGVRWIFNINPLTVPLEQARSLLFQGEVPSLGSIAFAMSVGGLAAVLGLWWFQKTRKGFADVV
ncbi:ABC transporter permease [Roseomonas sp. E05]|uniref:ABC transporter permease n=1 Tax=Roseomonas sp. E05 TaxID=3046310 RepID=UPI0024BA9059|nr:ABC transporter permease [Roseomonas sp. E05]MDJ0390563.1 ABC transporter permease [Roseomonas sp. E05]